MRVLLFALVGAFVAVALGLALARGDRIGSEGTTVAIAVAIGAAIATALVLRRR